MSLNRFESILLEIDAHWSGGLVPAPIRIIGSTALMFQAEYLRGTKDGDILGLDPVVGPVRDKLLELAGKGSEVHRRHQIYLDIVNPGLLFLPRPAQYHDLERLNGKLRHFRVSVLDVVDVVVSKLIRFNANDLDDIRAMVDLDRVPAKALVARFRSAMDWFLLDARADDLPRYVSNLNRIEREMLLFPPTAIQLPDWLGTD